jgi:hypothetical protein
VQFCLHMCTKSSRKFTQFTMNGGHFTIVENRVMMSTQEIMLRRYHYTCGEEKEIQSQKKAIFFQLCHDLHLWHSLW